MQPAIPISHINRAIKIIAAPATAVVVGMAVGDALATRITPWAAIPLTCGALLMLLAPAAAQQKVSLPPGSENAKNDVPDETWPRPGEGQPTISDAPELPPLPPPGERPDLTAAVGDTDAAAEWEARFAAAGRPLIIIDADSFIDQTVDTKIDSFLDQHPRGAVVLRIGGKPSTALEATLSRMSSRPGGPLIVLALRLGRQAISTLLSVPTSDRTRRLSARFAEDGMPTAARLLGACLVAPTRGLAAHAPAYAQSKKDSGGGGGAGVTASRQQEASLSPQEGLAGGSEQRPQAP